MESSELILIDRIGWTCAADAPLRRVVAACCVHACYAGIMSLKALKYLARSAPTESAGIDSAALIRLPRIGERSWPDVPDTTEIHSELL